MIGTTISHYRITAKLGEGGMGVVYKAEDTKLERTVALKFLATHLVGDDEGRERFLREAKAAAALDHNNICTVYEIDEAEGQTFLAMAFIEGQSLKDKIAERPLKLDEALDLAIQTARGLEAAHKKGIVHRDIKPANLMLSGDGTLKIMDFGLAQLAGRTKLTKTGSSLGTPAYMSPEQTLGDKTNHRSDIWSLGVVLYEMVTGQLPFKGDVEAALAYSIVNEEPEPLTALRTGLPVELDRIVGKALAKDTNDRYQHVDELLVDLRAARRLSDAAGAKASSAAATLTGKRSNAIRQVALLAAVVVVAVSVTWWMGRPRSGTSGDAPRYRLTQVTHDEGYTGEPALSPDGSLLAYSSDRAGQDNLDIWVQQVSGGEPIRLTTNEANDVTPSFSPDGSRIVFGSKRGGQIGGEGGIYVIPALGGNEKRIANAGSIPRFSPDGKWVSYRLGELRHGGVLRSRTFVVPAGGGSARPVEVDLLRFGETIWSPDGKYLLALASREEAGVSGSVLGDWWIVPFEGGSAINLGASEVFEKFRLQGLALGPGGLGSPRAWLPGDNRVVFSARFAGGAPNLWQVHLSPGDWRLVGEPVRLTAGTGETDPSVALGGRIAFASSSRNFDIWSLPIDANRARVLGPPEPLITGLTQESYPTISADGTKLLYVSDRAGNFDVWLRDLDSGEDTPVTITPQDETRAAISADGLKVAYHRREEDGKRNLYVIDLSSGAEKRVAEDIGSLMDWTPDGKEVVYHVGPPLKWMTVNAETGEASEILIDHPLHTIHVVRFSPDRQWLSFKLMIRDAGRIRIRSQPTVISPIRNGRPGGEEEWIRVTDNHIDSRNWWSPDGNVVYFLSFRDNFPCIWAQQLDPSTKKPNGPTVDILHFHGRQRQTSNAGFGYAMTADRLYFPVEETKSNIWLAEPQSQEP